MSMMPKRVKYRKAFKGRIRGDATTGHTVEFGSYGLQALEPGRITARQIEAGRVAATKLIRGKGRLFIRIFPHKPVSGKPAETRMGKGKGEVEYWAAVVKPGTILYEISGVPEPTAREAFNRVAHKMPIRVRLATRLAKIN